MCTFDYVHYGLRTCYGFWLTYFFIYVNVYIRYIIPPSSIITKVAQNSSKKMYYKELEWLSNQSVVLNYF